MTFKDKPKRSGGKPFDRDRNPKRDSRGPKAGFRDGDKQRPEKSERPARHAATAVAADPAKPERISKIMARAGVASRRDVERMILEGRVRLNGVVLDTPVVNATLADRIEVDGVAIRGIERTRLWLYHKPAGLVTTNSDPEGRPTVFDNLPEDLPRVLSIGRLDINTEGLLLLTNDGGLARALELPATGWLRRYRVRAHGEIDQADLDKLKEGIAVDGVLYGSIEATLDRTQGHNVWITMGLREGKNREIKNVLGALGLEVNRLIRISYGPFQLGDLPEGEVLEVRGRTLRDQLGPRLIDEAKANFEAPIYNEPAVAAPTVEEEPAEYERPRRERSDDRGDWGRRDERRGGGREGGERFGRKEGGDRFGDKPKRKPLGEIRTANVWMAPGARPAAGKGAPKSSETKIERPFAIEFKTSEESEGAKKRKPAPKRPARGDDARASDRPRGDRKPRPEGGDRPRSERPWQDRKPRGEGDERPRAKSFSGERRFERSEGDRPHGDKPRGDRKPRPEGGDRPRSDRPWQDRKPRGEGDERPRAKSFSGERRFERSEGDRPHGDKPRGDRKPRAEGGDRPRSDRPWQDRKPRGEGDDRPKSKGFSGERRSDRPEGGKPFAKKPGGKPFGGKPRSDRPDGDKPRGRPAGGKGMTRGADRRR